MKIDNFDDLNFIEEPLIVSGPFVVSAVELSAVDRNGFSYHPEPESDEHQRDQRRCQPASDGTCVQRPASRGQGPEGQCKASINPASSPPVCVQLTGTARQKPSRLFGPSVAPVVLFVLAGEWSPGD